jgi:hypothetical protein
MICLIIRVMEENDLKSKKAEIFADLVRLAERPTEGSRIWTESDIKRGKVFVPVPFELFNNASVQARFRNATKKFLDDISAE